ncbi:MAG: hypothetical protein JWM95_1744 [Gemmatimonadetes bacterium]|nr:hypothetical protein [Gemmatimonadota bacterium]
MPSTFENHLVGVCADAPHPAGYRPDLPLNSDEPSDITDLIEEAKEAAHDEGYDAGHDAGRLEEAREAREELVEEVREEVELEYSARFRKQEQELEAARDRITALTEHAA